MSLGGGREQQEQGECGWQASAPLSGGSRRQLLLRVSPVPRRASPPATPVPWPPQKFSKLTENSGFPSRTAVNVHSAVCSSEPRVALRSAQGVVVGNAAWRKRGSGPVRHGPGGVRRQRGWSTGCSGGTFASTVSRVALNCRVADGKRLLRGPMGGSDGPGNEADWPPPPRSPVLHDLHEPSRQEGGELGG